MHPRLRQARVFRSSAMIALVATAIIPLISAPSAQASTVSASASVATGWESTPVLGTRTVTAAGETHTLGLKALPGPRIAAGSRVSRLGIAAADVLPASVDLTTKTISPGNQGAIGSCVAWSQGYTLAGYYANAQKQTGSPYAPMYLYSQIHASTSADGGGALTSSGWNVLTTQGIAEKSVYTQGDFDFRTMPTAAQIANAATHKMARASYLFSGANQAGAGIDALKAALASGNPVELGIPVHSAFTTLNPSRSVLTAAMATGSVLGGHAIVAVGYNPTGLVVENSWGTNWGAGGYATLGWDFVGKYVMEASVTSGFSTTTGVPVVTGLSVASASAQGGGTMTVTGSALAAVDASAAGAVSLVNVANPSISVYAPVVSRTATTLTVSIPAAPAENGVAKLGAYRVVVTSPTGVSVDNGSSDDFSYLAPANFVVTGPTVIAASTGATVTLTGSGFGTSATAAAALKLFATVGGKVATLTWISDSVVTVAVPPGTPGQSVQIVLSRSGVLSASNGTLRYGANISSLSVKADPNGVRFGTVAGRGLLGGGGWTLTSPDGSRSTALPVVATSAELTLAGAGVLIAGDTSALIKLPAYPVGGIGDFRVSLTPNQVTYPGASFLPTPAAVVSYIAPTLTKVVGSSVVSAAGGSTLTVAGTNLTALDRGNPAAVRLISSTDSSVGVNVPVTALTPTSLTLAVPAAPSAPGGQITGDYRLVVTTAQGTLTAPSLISYLAPFKISVPAGGVLLATGPQTLTVRSSGFGSTAEAFKAEAVTAVLAGRTAVVTWVNDSTVRVAATTAGRPGATTTLTVSRRGVSSLGLPLTYVAAISAASVTTGPSTGGTLVTVNGAGFGGSSVWSVRALDGTVLSTLTRYGSTQDLNAVASGVVVVADSIAVIKMPAAASAGLSAAALGFRLDQSLYAGASSVTTSKAVFVYSDLA